MSWRILNSVRKKEQIAKNLSLPEPSKWHLKMSPRISWLNIKRKRRLKNSMLMKSERLKNSLTEEKPLKEWLSSTRIWSTLRILISLNMALMNSQCLKSKINLMKRLKLYLEKIAKELCKRWNSKENTKSSRKRGLKKRPSEKNRIKLTL